MRSAIGALVGDILFVEDDDGAAARASEFRTLGGDFNFSPFPHQANLSEVVDFFDFAVRVLRDLDDVTAERAFERAARRVEIDFGPTGRASELSTGWRRLRKRRLPVFERFG